MRVGLYLLMLVSGVFVGVITAERWEPGELPHVDGGSVAAPPAAPSPRATGAPHEAPEIEIITGGETTRVEDLAAAFLEKPIPVYRYDDGSGAILIAEGLDAVPARYRHSAVELTREGATRAVPPDEASAGAETEGAQSASPESADEPAFDPDRTRVLLFSSMGSAPCVLAREHLEHLGVPYELVDVHSDSTARRHVRRIMGGEVHVPLLKVGTRYVSGYLPREYDRLVQPAADAE
jgi:glutaredoxin